MLGSSCRQISLIWLRKLFGARVSLRSPTLLLIAIINCSVDFRELCYLGSGPLTARCHWIVHRLPLAVVVVAVWSQSRFLLNLREASICPALITRAKLDSLVFGKEKDCLEPHRLTFKPSIGYVIVARSVFHHVVDTTFALIRIKNLLDPSSS